MSEQRRPEEGTESQARTGQSDKRAVGVTGPDDGTRQRLLFSFSSTLLHLDLDLGLLAGLTCTFTFPFSI